MDNSMMLRKMAMGLMVGLICLNANTLFGQIQIVNCDEPVQSRKRGIAVNSMSGNDFRALEPGVSWYYNWSATPNSTMPADVDMEFLPMAWNNGSEFHTDIAAYLAAGNRPWRVLAINEPNLRGQAFITPQQTATAVNQIQDICDPYDIPVVGPHMAIGSATGDSITAYDPIQGATVTYTYQQPFLDAFLYYCDTNPPSGMATHSYSGYGEITWILNEMRTAYPTQPVWLTEFCYWDAASDAQALDTLIKAVDYCERTPWVEGYSWFMSRFSNPYNSLLNASGVLTPAGEAYVQMPVHDPNIYYRIPGRLEAERYVTFSQMDIAPTTDSDGLADMRSTAVNGILDYNVQVDFTGDYPVSFRVANAIGQIKVYNGATLLGTANATQTGWSTVSATIPLSAGAQTLSIVLATSGQKLNWVEFDAVDGTVARPTGVTATAGDQEVALSWSVSSGASGYIVKRSTTDGGPYSTIATPSTTSFMDTGVNNGTTYHYVVAATDGAQESADSLQVSAVPAVPTFLVSQGQSVTVSSTQSGQPGSYAVDGLAGTRWASDWSDSQWIYVDLGQTYDITKVVLSWEAAYGSSYQIQVSSNTVDWTTIYSTTTGTGGLEELTGLSGTGRYVRMYGTARATSYGYSLWEYEVYGVIPPPTQPPVLSATMTNGNFGFWIDGDLGADYTIEASTNLTAWSPIFTTNAATLPLFWVDDDYSSRPIRFYRVLLRP